jgi:hypothetical protein
MDRWIPKDMFKDSWLLKPMKATLRRLPRGGIKKPTAGLVNEVLHGRKINHTIIDPREKTKHLFRGV